MGFAKRVYLYCNSGEFDGVEHPFCALEGYEAFSAETHFSTVKEYKEFAKKEGWVFRGKKAYCPSCVKRRRIIKGERRSDL